MIIELLFVCVSFNFFLSLTTYLQVKQNRNEWVEFEVGVLLVYELNDIPLTKIQINS